MSPSHDHILQATLFTIASITGVLGFKLSDVDLLVGFILKLFSLVSVVLLILTTLGVIDKPFRKKGKETKNKKDATK